MEMIIIYILLIIILLGILWHIFYHLVAIFHQSTTDICVKEVMKNPYKYIMEEEMCYFFRNVFYLTCISILLFAFCNGNIKFNKTTNSIEISDK